MYRLSEEARIVVTESASSGYAARTKANAKRYDATVAFAIDYESAGERLTRAAAGEHWVAVSLHLPPHRASGELLRFVRNRQARTLNVAGHALSTLSKHGWDEKKADVWVFAVLATVHRDWPFTKIGSGGQTGIDLAGVAAGHALGVDVELHMPRGCIQRLANGRDVVRTRADVAEQVRRKAASMLTAST